MEKLSEGLLDMRKNVLIELNTRAISVVPIDKRDYEDLVRKVDIIHSAIIAESLEEGAVELAKPILTFINKNTELLSECFDQQFKLDEISHSNQSKI